MRECDIWADREPGSCGGDLEKGPLKPFVHLSLEYKRRRADLAVCCEHVLSFLSKEREIIRDTLDMFVFVGIKEKFFSRPEDCVVSAACFQRDAVPNFMANIDIHLISHSQSEIYSLLRMNLGTNHCAMLELD